MASSTTPPVVLFGYDSSPFTQKVRLVLKLKQIAYTFVIVPSMMPRPVLRDNFHLTYRKIPVLAIGREVYCDTSLIIEALEHAFSKDRPSIYPQTADGRTYRPLIRGFASYWTDRPFFRVTTGLIPSTVWRTHFGTDRAELIGHKLNPDKLEAKIPRNLSSLDLHLSILEPQFQSSTYVFSTPHPSLADISLYYQLSWGLDIAAGRGLANLTGGGTPDTNTAGATSVFNHERYPALSKWFKGMERYFKDLALTETRVEGSDEEGRRMVLERLKDYEPAATASGGEEVARLLLPTPAPAHEELDKKAGLVPGVKVSVAPDDTGRDDPTIGTLLALSPEEIIIRPTELSPPALVDGIHVHFPRIGFVVQPFTATARTGDGDRTGLGAVEGKAKL